ncbi:hypothetical protein BIW11_10460, partial [Tropilaelaps mercedesae]
MARPQVPSIVVGIAPLSELVTVDGEDDHQLEAENGGAGGCGGPSGPGTPVGSGAPDDDSSKSRLRRPRLKSQRSLGREAELRDERSLKEAPKQHSRGTVHKHTLKVLGRSHARDETSPPPEEPPLVKLRATRSEDNACISASCSSPSACSGSWPTQTQSMGGCPAAVTPVLTPLSATASPAMPPVAGPTPLGPTAVVQPGVGVGAVGPIGMGVNVAGLSAVALGT